MGVDIENTVTYQTFALLLAFLIFAFVSSFFFRAKFSATRLLPRFGTAGQPLFYRVQVKNLTAKNQSRPDAAGKSRRPAPGVCRLAGVSTRR